MKYIKEYAKYHRGEIDKKGNKISSKKEKLFDFLEDLGFEKKEITRTSFGQEIKNFVFQKDGIVIVLPTQDLEERHYSLARHTLISSDLIDNKKDFEMIFESIDDIELSDEQEKELLSLFSEKGWNLADKKIDFLNNFPNKEIAGKSGMIKSVKNEVATVLIDNLEYRIPFTQILDKTICKIHKNKSYGRIFDLQFAMAKIKDHFDEDKVIGMFDDEVLEWVDSDWEDEYESEYDWYVDHNNGEAQDSVITQIINWYKKEFNKTLSIDEHSELFDAIKSEYDCLNY